MFRYVTWLLLIVYCLHISVSKAAVRTGNYLVDYGEPHGLNLARAFRNTPYSELRIVQFGDSHTAAEFITEGLRNRLQSVYGVGSIGWVAPTYVAGQRSALIAHDTNNFKVLNAAVASTDNKFNLGGIISLANKNSSVTIKPRRGKFENVKLIVHARCPDDFCSVGVTYEGHTANSDLLFIGQDWSYKSLNNIYSSFITLSTAQEMALSGIYIKDHSKGVSVSSFGNNGARATLLSKLEPSWFKSLQSIVPNLIILAYGTNESFDNIFNIEDFKKNYIQTIRDIRKHNPTASILIVSNPDTFSNKTRNTNTMCYKKQSAQVNTIHDALVAIAKQEKTLFWDWRKYMGGKCSMATWINNKKSVDGIHFKVDPYYEFGEAIARNLESWVAKKLTPAKKTTPAPVKKTTTTPAKKTTPAPAKKPATTPAKKPTTTPAKKPANTPAKKTTNTK